MLYRSRCAIRPSVDAACRNVKRALSAVWGTNLCRVYQRARHDNRHMVSVATELASLAAAGFACPAGVPVSREVE